MKEASLSLNFSRESARSVVVVRGDGVDGGEDDGLDLLEARQRLCAGAVLQGDRVARADVGDGLHAGDDVAHIPRGEALPLLPLAAGSGRPLPPGRWRRCT